MNNSIAFAKWFINKHSNTGILVDGNDLQFILSQLDQSSWDEFSAINSVKDTVDNLIPILVPPMPKTKRAPKATTTGENIKSEDKQVKKRAPKAAKISDTPLVEGDNSDIVKPEDKQVKKRAPKAAKISDTPLVEGDNSDIVKSDGKQVKKRAPKAAKISDTPLVEGDNSDIVKSDGKQLKDVKKRAPKAADITDATTVEEGGDVKKEVKKRAPKAAKISDIIGFTDFEEGSKSEIFRRCDIGASNENQVPVAVLPDAVNHTENIVQSVAVNHTENIVQSVAVNPSENIVQSVAVNHTENIVQSVAVNPSENIVQSVAVNPAENIVQSVAVNPSENIVQSVAVEKVVKKREPKVKNELPIDKKEPKKRGPKAAKISIPVTEPLSENTPGTVDVIIPNEEHAKLTLIMPEEQDLQEDLVLTEVFIDDVLFYTDVEGNFYNNAFEKIQNPY